MLNNRLFMTSYCVNLAMFLVSTIVAEHPKYRMRKMTVESREMYTIYLKTMEGR